MKIVAYKHSLLIVLLYKQVLYLTEKVAVKNHF